MVSVACPWSGGPGMGAPRRVTLATGSRPVWGSRHARNLAARGAARRAGWLGGGAELAPVRRAAWLPAAAPGRAAAPRVRGHPVLAGLQRRPGPHQPAPG